MSWRNACFIWLFCCFGWGAIYVATGVTLALLTALLSGGTAILCASMEDQDGD